MGYNRRTALVATAILIVSGVASSAGARERRLVHPPIHVATPTDRSPITPYVFPYGSHYRYNSPGPVYYQLEYRGPGERCRLWRYNYSYWIC